MAEVATANDYPDHAQDGRGAIDRIVFIDLVFFIINSEATRFDKRAALAKTMADYDSAQDFRRLLLGARKLLAAPYLTNPNADLKLPDVETSRKAFWQMVSEAVELALQKT
jgi:hypothetical protein